MPEKIKVLVVDDAAFMRKTIRKILAKEPRLQVIGTAKNGQEAIKMNNELAPDVVTLDIDMPVMDGITALKHMMVQRPVAVVVVSSLSYETDVTFEAYRLGVIDFVPKPAGAISKELEKQQDYICTVVSKAAQVNAQKIQRVCLPASRPVKNAQRYPTKKLVIVGASLGGTLPLIRLLANLPNTADFAIWAVVQMSAKIMDSLVQKLDTVSPFKVVRARVGITLQRGEVYLRSREEPALALTENVEGNLTFLDQPNDFPLDQAMYSAVALKQLPVGAVLLAGDDQDGLGGIKAIYAKTGRVIIQNPDHAIFERNPTLACQQGGYWQIGGNADIGKYLVDMMSSNTEAR